jgi:putative transposase
MVERPEQYRWPSFGYHALGQANPLIRDHPLYIALGRTEEERRNAYQALFRHTLEPAELKQIREALNHGLVVGSRGFRQHVEKALGRLVRTPVRGRPRKFIARERLARYHRRLALQK